jgi:hypothetical protein
MAAHKVDMFPSINDADLDALLEARDANDTKNVIKNVFSLSNSALFVCQFTLS